MAQFPAIVLPFMKVSKSLDPEPYTPPDGAVGPSCKFDPKS